MEMKDSEWFGYNAWAYYGAEPPQIRLVKLPGCNDTFPSS